MFVYIIIAILLCSALLYDRKKHKENDTWGVLLRFVLIAWIWGICFSFIIIPWQTPDEYTHLHMIGIEMKNEAFAELLLNDMPLDKGRIAFNSNEKVDLAL